VSKYDLFLDAYVEARHKAWIVGNRSESPFGVGGEKQASPQHLATWRDMGREEAAKQGFKPVEPTIPPPPPSSSARK